jgi:hypothetical protein
MIKCVAATNTGWNALSVVDASDASNQTVYIRTSGAAYFEKNLGIGIQEGFVGTALGFQLRLSADSAAKPSTTTWTVSCDERLKEDIEAADVDVCYENVKKIPLKYYKWRDNVYTEEQVADRHKLGWIAQDVREVFPKAVSVLEMNGLDDCLTLNADQLYASMYGALQKVIALVETQEETIDTMSRRVAELTERVGDMVLET